jgi:hypothetical protein
MGHPSYFNLMWLDQSKMWGLPPGFRQEKLELLGCPISRVFCEKWGPPISTTSDLREKRPCSPIRRRCGPPAYECTTKYPAGFQLWDGWITGECIKRPDWDKGEDDDWEP